MLKGAVVTLSLPKGDKRNTAVTLVYRRVINEMLLCVPLNHPSASSGRHSLQRNTPVTLSVLKGDERNVNVTLSVSKGDKRNATVRSFESSFGRLLICKRFKSHNLFLFLNCT
jgi:hypothetical protein